VKAGNIAADVRFIFFIKVFFVHVVEFNLELLPQTRN
jgi:hypothetical protein